MNDGIPYTYVILRYRHDPLAGEAVNVGVVLHASGYLGCRFRRTVGRLTKVFPDLDRAALMNGLRVVERGIDKLRARDASGLLDGLGNAARYASRAMPVEDSSLVWSDLGSGLARDLNKALDRLYARFVVRYDEDGRSSRSDEEVWQPVREMLAQRQLADRLVPKTIVSPVDTVEFDYAWKNGAWHCYQPLSFDLSTSEGIREKAARWSGHMTGLTLASERVRPHFVVGAPADPALTEDYLRAVELLRASALQPEVFDETQIATLVSRMSLEIHDHDRQSQL